jgi:tRNA (guanine37-N1)-methyltransferase
LEEESFSDGFMLEYPQYTRPEVFRENRVPEVLLSGHHKNIAQWRKIQSVEKTKRLRPDLLG